ncbi:aromatic acid exporter family protein [Ammoniphilus sp. YIM 78166]|uniref:FUSC family protein n=1 Tax=Ammoniphilus sp. YIM 78166 TaxID=1644106 RepID=UPI00106FA088|nr:aromatic acid exporter family protein [Ammoniphilus sp. YIM 78166]
MYAFGRRTIKTAISVMASLFIANLLGLEPAVFAAVAAALSIQPTNKRSMRYAVEQIQANMAGAFIGVVIAMFFGVHLYTVALAIIVVITITNLFKWKDSIPLSIVTVIFIMEAPTEDFLFYAWNRFLITFVGVVVSGVINVTLLPPKYVTHLRRHYEQALKLLIVYISKWQADGVFHLKEMNGLKDVIQRTHQFEQWMREQSKSEVHPKGYYKGLHIESSKNELLSDFLLVTEHYSRISWTEEDRSKSQEQIKGLYEYVLAVMAHTHLPQGYGIDLAWWKEIYLRNPDSSIEQSYIEILAALGRMEKRLRRYNRYVSKENKISLLTEENRWLAWKWRW